MSATEVDDNNSLWLCGDRNYVVVDSSDVAVPWISIAAAKPTYTITLQPVAEALVGPTLAYKLKITFKDARYPTPVLRKDFPVTISAATCDCNKLLWDAPTMLDKVVDVALGPLSVTIPTATQNANSKLPTPEIRKCFATGGNNCASTSTWTPIVVATNNLPSFIVQTGTTDALTITPTTAAHMGTWTIKVTQTITYAAFGTPKTVVFDAVKVTVGCTISTIPNPSPPTTGLTYNLYD